jgi:hypothetical protein
MFELLLFMLDMGAALLVMAMLFIDVLRLSRASPEVSVGLLFSCVTDEGAK